MHSMIVHIHAPPYYSLHNIFIYYMLSFLYPHAARARVRFLCAYSRGLSSEIYVYSDFRRVHTATLGQRAQSEQMFFAQCVRVPRATLAACNRPKYLHYARACGFFCARCCVELYAAHTRCT